MNLSAPPLLLTAHSIGHVGVPVQSFPRWESQNNVVWKLQSVGSYNESFLQWPKVFASLPINGEIVVAIPNRGVMLASPKKDFEALADAAQKSILERPCPLSGLVFTILDGRVELCSAPECQVRLNTLSNLSLQSVYKMQQEALRAHCDAIEEHVFIATFGLLAPKDHPEQAQSWCSWTEDVESLLPKTDLIAFVRNPSHSGKTLLVNWQDAAAVVARKMRETSEDPPRTQVDEFPSADEWGGTRKTCNRGCSHLGLTKSARGFDARWLESGDRSRFCVRFTQ